MMDERRRKERDGWFADGSASAEMDNSVVHAKGMHVVQFIAAAVIFTLQYVTGHSALESAFDAVITYVGAEISLCVYRRIWPKRRGS